MPNAVTNEMFPELRKHSSDEQVVEIVGVIAMFGFSIVERHLRDTVEAEPLDFGEASCGSGLGRRQAFALRQWGFRRIAMHRLLGFRLRAFRLPCFRWSGLHSRRRSHRNGALMLSRPPVPMTAVETVDDEVRVAIGQAWFRLAGEPIRLKPAPAPPRCAILRACRMRGSQSAGRGSPAPGWSSRQPVIATACWAMRSRPVVW